MNETILPIGIRLLNEDARVPVYSTKGAAGCDIYATEDFTVEPAKVVYQSDKELNTVEPYVLDEYSYWLREKEKEQKELKKKYKQLIKEADSIKEEERLEEMYEVERFAKESEFHFKTFNAMLTTFSKLATVKLGTYVTKVGIAFDIPEGSNIELELRGRSGLAFKSEMIAFNGTLDEDFKGELGIKLWNFGTEAIHFKKGDRVAQGVFKQVIQANFVDPKYLPYHKYFDLTRELRKQLANVTDTERGINWAGSTGLGDNGREVVQVGVVGEIKGQEVSKLVGEVKPTQETFFVNPPKEEKLYAFEPKEDLDVDADSDLIVVVKEGEETFEPLEGVQEISENELPFSLVDTLSERQLKEEEAVAKSIEEFKQGGCFGHHVREVTNEIKLEEDMEAKNVIEISSSDNKDLKESKNSTQTVEDDTENKLEVELVDTYVYLDVKANKNVYLHFADTILLKNGDKKEEFGIVDTNYYREEGTIIEYTIRVPKANQGNYTVVGIYNKGLLEEHEVDKVVMESAYVPVAIQYKGSQQSTIYKIREVGVGRGFDNKNVLLGNLKLTVSYENLRGIELVEVALKEKEGTKEIYLKGYVIESGYVKQGEYLLNIAFPVDAYPQVNNIVLDGAKLSIEVLKDLGYEIDTIHMSESVVSGTHAYTELDTKSTDLVIINAENTNKMELHGEEVTLYIPTT